MKLNFIIGVLVGCVVSSLVFYLGYNSLAGKLYCDVYSSMNAERSYVYPALKELGKDPTDYGKGVVNPIAKTDKYSKYCK